MDVRTFHGLATPVDFAQALIAEFNHGDITARKFGRGDQLVVQIASRDRPVSGGRTALAVHLLAVEDGVLVRVGQQELTGVAASLGLTTLSALVNPRSLLHRLDDIAQDIQSLQLSVRVWQSVERIADSLGATYEISARLRRLTCSYCGTAIPVGEAHCLACGAPQGAAQPRACSECGFIVPPDVSRCPKCDSPIPGA
jgi:hypothetical protein